MDILNWVYLLKNKLVKTTVQDPEKDLLILGNNVSYVKRGDKYQSYGMTVQDFAEYVNESVTGNCPIQMNFKPGSIGEKVSFTKASGSDPYDNRDIIIPGLLEITRGNGGGGIYNIAQEVSFNSSISPINTQWTTQYLDPANTGWTPLWDLTSRTYNTWRDAVEVPSGNNAPPQYVGMPAIMKYDDGDIVKYYLIMFTEWGVGGYNEYGFAYDRYEILDSVFFEQPSADNTNTPNVIDIVSDGVHITRSYNGGQIYNVVNEPYAETGVSPRNTKWNSSFTDSRPGYSGFQDLSNLESRVYTDFANALDGSVGNNVLDTDLIMHDVTTDLYYKVVFDAWAQGCGNGGPGSATNYDTLDAGGSGYPEGGWTTLNGIGGSGTDIQMIIIVTGGVITTMQLQNGGQNYQVGDVITFPYPGVTEPIVIEVTEICSMGGFAYTRTVIPQSCGVKFADGTIMNTAVTAAAAGTEMNYVTGLLSPQVESDFIALPDTITDDGGTTYKTYKLGGIASFDAPGTSAYSYLIGVISGDSKLKMINDASVIGSSSITTFNQVSGKFAVNALVRNQSTGVAIPLTFATIVLDNTIAGLNDYFVSIVATAGASWSGRAYIDIEFMSDQTLAYYN
jgi:hypothetical protein